MATLALTAGAQALDPASYAATAGYKLESKWMMSAGDGTNGVAMQAWNDLSAKFANAGKATTAALLDGKIYIACSQKFVPQVDENGQPFQGLDHFSHLVVVDAETGTFIKDLNLTLDGADFAGLLGVNSIGVDDAGHLWVCGLVEKYYDQTQGGALKPFKLYVIDTETGAATLVKEFLMPDADGPNSGTRVDYYDVMGDLLGAENPDDNGACFLAVPRDVPNVIVFVRYPGEAEWDIMVASETNLIMCKETYPAGKTAWNYSPMASFVKTDDVENILVWVDGHTTCPALYDATGELLSSHKLHQGDAPSETEPEGGPWANFLPKDQANGVIQFSLGSDAFLAYALKFPDNTNLGGNMAIVKLDANETLDEATPLWVAPKGTLGINKGEGRFSHSIAVSPEYTDDNGKVARDIIVYKDMNGLACYRIAEEGFQAGVNDIVSDADADAPVEYFNLQGVRMQGELAPGLYITRQGNTVNKVIVK